MKAITMILLSIFLGKSCTNEAQNDLINTTIQYTANSRGFYQKIIIINQKATISRDRNEGALPEEIIIADADWKELVAAFGKINLEEIPKLKDPTQKRFYDGAAIANLKIRYQDQEYETTDFDHGFPPKEIEKLVNKIVALAKEKEE
jgi:ribosomal protein L17